MVFGNILKVCEQYYDELIRKVILQGDSGGSLVCKNSFGQDELVGILSGAAGCGNFTMFFANVYLLLRFIEDQIHSFTNRTDITQTTLGNKMSFAHSTIYHTPILMNALSVLSLLLIL